MRRAKLQRHYLENLSIIVDIIVRIQYAHALKFFHLSPVRSCIALDKESLLELSGRARPCLVRVTSMWVVQAHCSILARH